MSNIQAKIRRIQYRLERDTALLYYYTSFVEEETPPLFSPYVYEPTLMDRIVPYASPIIGFSLLVLLFTGVI